MRERRLDGLRVLTTGSANGIGCSLVGLLLERGARVWATDLDLPTLERRASEQGWPAERVRLAQLDVRDAEAWDAQLANATAALGGVDVLLNVAGFLRPGEIRDTEVDDVHRHFDVNVKGVVFGTRAAARQMVERGSGHIVNFASLASLAPIPGIGLYSASKYAVRGFSLVAAEELRAHGVAVTAVCPDAVQTPMLDLQLDYDEAALTFTAPRVYSADEVARRVVDQVLRRRPLVAAFPRRRAWLARGADLFPRSTRLLTGLLRRQGRRRQAARRDQRTRSSSS